MARFPRWTFLKFYADDQAGATFKSLYFGEFLASAGRSNRPVMTRSMASARSLGVRLQMGGLS
jgi:hypothetical protein